MGYMMVHGPCAVCGMIVSGNPNLVPSLGRQQMLCENCVHRINEARKKQGMEPFVIPEGAYDPVDEREVPYD